jgi:hypothetical protein
LSVSPIAKSIRRLQVLEAISIYACNFTTTHHPNFIFASEVVFIYLYHPSNFRFDSFGFDLVAAVYRIMFTAGISGTGFLLHFFPIGRNVAYRLTAFVGIALLCLFYKPYFNLTSIFRIHVFKKWLEFYNHAAVQSHIHVGNCKNSSLRPLEIRVKKSFVLTSSLALTEFAYVDSPGREVERRLLH